ncbi:MAG: ferrous iron transporter B [Bacillota bacterium]|nr:ferrous iron transporter B [Bacillota bacterium]HHU62305.1 ferrous iron transporter B [Natronincola sp.]
MFKPYLVALAGNPNTGKSTIFNSLTGLKQHTGNWPGKTVLQAKGSYHHQGKGFDVVDLPGTYSLFASSPEEEVARDFILHSQPHVTVIVVDATCLERNLNLVMQISELTSQVVVCVNLMDEAKRKKLKLDLHRLEQELGVPVVPTVATTGEGLRELKDTIVRVASGKLQPSPNNIRLQNTNIGDIYARAEEIVDRVVDDTLTAQESCSERIDKILTSRLFGIPIMLALLALILWITIIGANYPSEMLAQFFFKTEQYLTQLFVGLNSPSWLHGLLVLGLFRGSAWVISVMLPPMAIFFPIFTLLEDLGYLPRVAFNLDHLFRKSGAHGKQALTMSMGFGCNAAGVIAARIIDSPRERLVAILTNNFVPCNGRFPILIVVGAIIAGYATGMSSYGFFAALVVLGGIMLGILASLAISKFLSSTILKGEQSYFIMELPPYRIPRIGTVLVRSFIDRTLAVLARAIIVAAPVGMLTWLFANISVNDLSLMSHAANWLNPIGQAMGLDGVILLGFILGLPANEIIIPIILMSYLAQGSLIELESITAIKKLLIENGWTWLTAINFMILTIFHWPCGTTLLTIKTETGKWKWTIISALIPTVLGVLACLFLTKIVGLLV